MAEFSTTKITPTDGVQVPSVSGSTSGYMEMDEVKSYVVGTLPTDVQTNTEDIGENTSDIEGIRGSSQAFDATAAYSAGDYCIYENVLYRFTSAKSAGAWDSAIVAVVDLPTLDGALTSLSTINDFTITPSAGVTFNGQAFSINGLFIINGYFSFSTTTTSTNGVLGTVPSNARPTSTVTVSTFDATNDTSITGYLYGNNGEIKFYRSSSQSTGNIRVMCVYKLD